MNEISQNITLGILGGGQLGQMSAIAASKLGIKTIIYTPEQDSPAAQVAEKTIVASYDDEDELKLFAQSVDYITYEFENIPVKTVRYLNTLKPVYPDERLLEVSQDRIAEKKFLNDIGIPTTRWSHPKSPQDITNTLKKWGVNQCILKTTRFGYDGKGQARLTRDTNLEALWSEFKETPIIMEEIINFECEISVIVARDRNKHIVNYGPMLNVHKHHILDKTTVPAPIHNHLAQNAIKTIKKLAEQLDLKGILTLELFVTRDNQIFANEIAPRTHNSGHWSIDACEHSQFENHVRAVCDLPVLAPNRHSDALMFNLIGDDITNIAQYQNQPNTHLHNYGKHDIKEGRKMGHVTILKEKTQKEQS